MLDKAQIKAAHNRAIYLMGVSSKLDDSQALDMVLDALAAYERVVAALDGLKRQRDMEPEGSMARLLLAGFCAVIEHALNGG